MATYNVLCSSCSLEHKFKNINYKTIDSPDPSLLPLPPQNWLYKPKSEKHKFQSYDCQHIRSSPEIRNEEF